MKEIRVPSIASVRPQYDVSMMSLLICRGVYIETTLGSCRKSQRKTMSTPVVKLDRELAIHHADFVDDEVSTIGPSELFFRLIWCVVSTLSAGMCTLQGAVQRGSLVANQALTGSTTRLLLVSASPKSPISSC